MLDGLRRDIEQATMQAARETMREASQQAEAGIVDRLFPGNTMSQSRQTRTRGRVRFDSQEPSIWVGTNTLSFASYYGQETMKSKQVRPEHKVLYNSKTGFFYVVPSNYARPDVEGTLAWLGGLIKQ